MDNKKVITLENLEEYDTGLKEKINENFATKEELEKINCTMSTVSLPSFSDPTLLIRL